jgi:hypothetical protein
MALEVDGGTQTVECAECGWALPPGRHTGLGDSGRPGGADYIDTALPLLSGHVTSTGHEVRVVLTSWWPLEQTSMLIGPRT